jgi:hypothetical protein
MDAHVPSHKYKDGKPMYGEVPLWAMLKNFHEVKSKKELICSLDQALVYQKIAENVYRVAGKTRSNKRDK